MNNWISVNDRLPEKSGKYKIKGTTGSINPKPFEEISNYVKRANEYGYWGTCFDWKQATHWQPLPESSNG